MCTTVVHTLVVTVRYIKLLPICEMGCKLSSYVILLQIFEVEIAFTGNPDTFEIYSFDRFGGNPDFLWQPWDVKRGIRWYS